MIHSIKAWFKAAKPNPSTADVCVQIGCHYEEVSAVQTLRDRYMISTDVTLHGGV